MSGQNERREKFTQGPWEATMFNGKSKHEIIYFEIEGPNGEHVAENHQCGGNTPETDSANATLIAAAPEMYEELQRAFERFDDFSKFAVLQGAATKLLKNDVERIEKLLQKARGEA